MTIDSIWFNNILKGQLPSEIPKEKICYNYSDCIGVAVNDLNDNELYILCSFLLEVRLPILLLYDTEYSTNANPLFEIRKDWMRFFGNSIMDSYNEDYDNIKLTNEEQIQYDIYKLMRVL